MMDVLLYLEIEKVLKNCRNTYIETALSIDSIKEKYCSDVDDEQINNTVENMNEMIDKIDAIRKRMSTKREKLKRKLTVQKHLKKYIL